MNWLARNAPFAAVVFAITACAQLENDLRSSSDSSGSDSGSRSSGSGAGVHASASYQRDVYTYTVACVNRDEPEGELLRGVGRIAFGRSCAQSDDDTVEFVLTA